MKVLALGVIIGCAQPSATRITAAPVAADHDHDHEGIGDGPRASERAPAPADDTTPPPRRFVRRPTSTRPPHTPIREPLDDVRKVFWDRERARERLDDHARRDGEVHRAEREWLEIQLECAHGDRDEAKALAARHAREQAARCSESDPSSCRNPFARVLLSPEAVLGAPQRLCEFAALAILDAAFSDPPDAWSSRLAHTCEQSLHTAEQLRRLRELPRPACPSLCVDPPLATAQLPEGLQCFGAKLRARHESQWGQDIGAGAKMLYTPFDLEVRAVTHGEFVPGQLVRVWQAGGNKDGVDITVDRFSVPDLDTEWIGEFDICILPHGRDWMATSDEARWRARHAKDLEWWATYCAP